ncbi:DUF4272 domain-containing protein [Flavobacterium sp. '19STA2R22 D10 B1']|uniref:DUF4272 domain-containing protein n=1 Tax=Flavobacterium aerium TaxID=3037261 RepID=UPI00278C1239|nr:DUF4272 domain-containing protein [Flavobacterium sp. '19STA2R22 D10 B1']
MTEELKYRIKLINDNIIKQKGYRVNDWLPVLETPTIRTLKEIKGRMSVMNALINIVFNKPTSIVKEWIHQHDLSQYLSTVEHQLLSKKNIHLSSLEINLLRSYIESLWTLMWVTKMIDKLDDEELIGDNMAMLLPNLSQDNCKLDKLKEMRSETGIYTMLDFYHRLHWYCKDERTHGRVPKLYERKIFGRRKALKWIFNKENDWDNVGENN